MTELPVKVTYEDDASDGLGGLAGILDGLGNIAGGAVAVAFGNILTDAIEGAGAALSRFVGQAAEAEVQQASLVALLNSTAGASGMTQEAVNQLANQFRDLAGGSDEAVVAIEEIGIRSGEISSAQMPQFIQSVLDLGTVMGSTTTAAELLARAQEDPLGAFTRLERQTGVYDQALKANIQTMVKAGDTAGAVAQIMDYVARTTGGSAAAAADTLSGKWSILTNHAEDFFKALAEHVLPMLERLLDVAVPILDGFYQSFENTFIPLIDDAAAWGEGIINALASGMASAASAVVDVINQLGAIIAAWMKPGSPPKFLPDLDKWGEAAVNVYMGGWANFDKSVFDELYKAIKGGLPTEEIQQYADATQALTQAQDALNTVTEHYDNLINPLSAKLKGIQFQQEKLKDAAEIEKLKAILSDNGYSAADKDAARLEIQAIMTREQIDGLNLQKDAEVGAAKTKVDAAKTAADNLKAQIDLQLQFVKSTNDGAGAAGSLAKALKGVGDAVHALSGAGAGAFTPISSAMDQLKSDVALNADAIKGKIDGFVTDVKGLVDQLKQDIAGAADFFKPISEALDHAKQAFVEKLPAMELNWKGTWELIKRDLEIVAPETTADVRAMVTDIGQLLDGLVTLWHDHFGTLSVIQSVFTTTMITVLGVGLRTVSGLGKLFWDNMVDFFKVGYAAITGDNAAFVKALNDATKHALDNMLAIVRDDLKLVVEAFGLNFDEIAGKVQSAVDLVKTAVSDALKALQGLWDFITGHNFNVSVSIPGLPDGRAEGGPVTGGTPYMVGERGPELFVPRQSGTIVPNGAGAGVTINVDARGSNDPASIEQAGYRGAQRALSEAGYRSDQLLRMGTIGA